MLLLLLEIRWIMGDNINYYIGIYSVNQTDDVTQFITCSLPWFEQKLPYREEYAFENTRDVGAKSQRWQEWYQMKPFDHFYRFVFFCWHFPPQPPPPPSSIWLHLRDSLSSDTTFPREICASVPEDKNRNFYNWCKVH